MPPLMLGWMGCNGLVSTAAEPPLRSGQVRLPSAGMQTQEAFEGEREGIAYRQIVEETQRQMMSWFLSFFLPWVPQLRSDRNDQVRCQ